jgi:hypothetical protein
MGRAKDEIDRANLSRAREINALAAESKRRSAKGKPVAVSREEVDVLMAAMTPQGRAEVAHMAAAKLGRRTLPWMTR